MYCKFCGKEVGDAAWCPYCGAKQGDDGQNKDTGANFYAGAESQNAWGEQVNLSRPARTNGFAVAGLILAFFSPLLGIIFSIIGMTKVAEYGSGKGMAVAGIIISVLNFIFSIVAYFVYMPMVMAVISQLGL